MLEKLVAVSANFSSQISSTTIPLPDEVSLCMFCVRFGDGFLKLVFMFLFMLNAKPKSH